MFNLALVDDKIVYKDESNKRLGDEVKGGKKSLSTDTIYNVTARSGVYKRKKSVKMEGKSAIKVKSAYKLNQLLLNRFNVKLSANEIYGTSEEASKQSELETISFLKSVTNLFTGVNSKEGGL